MKRRVFSFLCALVLIFCALPAPAASAAGAQSAFLKAEGHLESAYIEWADVEGAAGYQVWIKAADAADSAYTRLDDQLVRRYPDRWRADALGLAAGQYVMKVVPVIGSEAGEALVTDPLTVLAQDRDGYAFFNGAQPGAYKADGTLKDGARVVYITQDNKNNLPNVINSAGGSTPLDVRIIGQVTAFDSSYVLDVKTKNANLTIEGVGNDATAYGWGFNLKNCSYVELRNLAIMMVASGEGDGVTLDTADYTWVHNCDFFYNKRQNDPEGDKEKGDGSLDTKRSHYVTHSYNHFWDAGKCSLQGSNTSDTSDWITYHHNWYDHSDERHPRVRNAHVHVYNNLYDDNDEYGIAACHDSTVFAENNYFDGCPRPMVTANQANGSGFGSDNGGVLKAYGNIIRNATACVPYSENQTDYDYYDASAKDARVPASVKSKQGGNTYDNFDTDASKFYTYRLDRAEDVPARVRACAGRVGGGTFVFDMDDLTYQKRTDTDPEFNREYYHHPDPALMAAIRSYSCDLVSVGGGAADIVEPIVGRTYVLTGDAVYADMKAGRGPSSFKEQTGGSNLGSWQTSAQTSQKAGTDAFFTLLYSGSSRIDPGKAVTWTGTDAYEGDSRINFNGGVTTSVNAVKFETSDRALVKVWWVGAVSAEQASQKDPRPMVVLDSRGNVAAGPSGTVANDVTPMCSTFVLESPGTYYLGGQGGKNFIYKVAVTVQGEEEPPAESWDDLSWQVKDGVLSLTGTVPAGETVWAACWDEDGFLGARALTGSDPTATLPDGTTRGKLIWLTALRAPKCANETF